MTAGQQSEVLTKSRPATEARDLSSDPAFGDFNLPLDRGGPFGLSLAQKLSAEDECDIGCLREALADDDFVPYEDFRRGELGL